MNKTVDNDSGIHSIKVLLVEDSPTDARLLMHDLKDVQGNVFDVTWVERMSDAVAQLNKQSFDVGLLDLSLPDSSGIDTFAKILEAEPALPVVILTGAVDEAMGVEAIRHGVQDYLVKGFADGKTVARAIRYAVERKMGEDAIRKLNNELEQRVLDVQTINSALRESHQAALNLMEDALSARKQAEGANAELFTSREEWVETFNVIPDHICILDNDHKIVRANKAMANKLGLLPEEMVGKSCHMCVHGSKNPISGCPHSQMLKDGKQHIAEVYEDRLGGDFLVSVTPILDKAGNIAGSVHVARDITERKKREDELYRLNRTLEALSKSSQAMTRTSDEQEFLDEVCRIVVEDCGYAMVWIGYAQNDEQKSIKPVAHAGFEQGYLETLNLSWADIDRGRGPTGTAIRTGSISQCRNMQTDPAFLPWREEAIKRGYASSICVPLVIYDKPFGAITIYSREPDSFSESEARLLVELANDLAYGITTIRLRAAQAKAEESLRNEHNFINTILQTTGGLIVGLDPEGRIKIFNHSCERTTGYTFSDVKDRVFWEFLLIPEEVDGVKAVFKNLSDQPTQSEYENYWVARDGARRFIRWTNSTVLDKNGNIELVVGTGIDITERKQAEIELDRYKTDLERLVRERTAALRASEEQLMKANEMKLLGQLTSGVAHEVRNPLNGIVAIMSALSQELSDSEDFKPYLQHMRTQVTRLTVLMEDLLMLGRPIKKEKMADVSLVEVVRSTLSSWQHGVQGKREVQFAAPEIADCGVRILADTTKIEQMVVNLLDNAHQHTPPEKCIELSIREPEKGTVLFSVKDSGPGIPTDVMPRIFEPFFTTRKGGTGLGLSIVRHIVESHGGNIRAFNNVGCPGTTFEVRLPVAIAETSYSKK
jgi:PAS domain S-box-containing protein